MTYYGIEQETMYVLCDNRSVIDISKNLVQHSWTKYRHYASFHSWSSGGENHIIASHSYWKSIGRHFHKTIGCNSILRKSLRTSLIRWNSINFRLFNYARTFSHDQDCLILYFVALHGSLLILTQPSLPLFFERCHGNRDELEDQGYLRICVIASIWLKTFFWRRLPYSLVWKSPMMARYYNWVCPLNLKKKKKRGGIKFSAKRKIKK